jgi:hypothetical protein
MAMWSRKLVASKIVRAIGGLCALGTINLWVRPARAALGDDVAAVEQDRIHMQASVKMSRRPSYDIHELATSTGTVVREFVGGDGKVFAVSWSGGWRPNLRDIMGAHYDRYIANTRGHLRARGPVRIELPGMVVFMGGYLRTFFGHVYLTEQLPQGFSVEGME